MKTLLFSLLCLGSCLHSKEVSLFLVRHGETDWNVEKRVQGHTDNPLNAKGIAQAKTTAEKLVSEHADIKAIYSSDLCRAYETAKETADKLGLPITTSSLLRELNTGIVEGMKTEEKVALYQESWDALKEKYPDKRERWNYSSIPGEETISSLLARTKAELAHISEIAVDQDKIAIFCHQKIIQALIADIEDRELAEVVVPNCAIVELLYRAENSKEVSFSIASKPS